MLLVKEEGTRVDGRSSDFGTGQCVQSLNPGRPFELLYWKLFGLFLSCKMILDIRIVLQSQEFPNKAHNHSRIRVLCNSAHQQRK